MHSEQGLNRTLMGLLLKSLTTKYFKKLAREVSSGLLAQQWPWKIPRVKLSKEGKINLTFTQTSRFIQMSPFILVRAVPTLQGVTQQDWLKPRMFTKEAKLELVRAVGKNFCQEIRTGFILAAASNAAVSVEERAPGPKPVRDMAYAIRAARHQNERVWGSALHRPNAHTGLHIPEGADLFAVPNNVNGGRFENRHAAPKRVAADSNNRGLERQMLIDAQIQEALVYLGKGGALGPSHASISASALDMLHEPDTAIARLLGSCDSKDHHGGREGEGFDDVFAVSSGASSAVVFNKFVERYSLSAEESEDAKVEDAGLIVNSYQQLGLPQREPYRASVTSGEYWQVRPPAQFNSPAVIMPTGPSTGAALVRVSNILQIDNVPYVRVVWLGRAGSIPQKMTMCYKYALCTAGQYPRLIPAIWLEKRVHVFDASGAQLWNPFFVK